jgi:hypothetical protein
MSRGVLPNEVGSTHMRYRGQVNDIVTGSTPVPLTGVNSEGRVCLIGKQKC